MNIDHERLAEPVDADRHESLRALLHARLDSVGVGRSPEHAPLAPEPAETVWIKEMDVSNEPTQPAHHRKLAMGIAAAVIIAVGGTTALLIGGGSPSNSSAATEPQSVSEDSATPPSLAATPTSVAPTIAATLPTSAPPATEPAVVATTPPVASDADISAAILAGNEFPLSWTPSHIHYVAMDGTIAAQIPECAPFEAAFESASRPAVVDYDMWYSSLGEGLSVRYVVVFPDEEAAIEMFDSSSSLELLGPCSNAYIALADSTFDQKPYEFGYIFTPFLIGPGDLSSVHPPLNVEADQQWTADITTTDAQVHILTSVLRVGRVVAIVTGALQMGQFEILTEPQYEAVVADVADRATVALAAD